MFEDTVTSLLLINPHRNVVIACELPFAASAIAVVRSAGGAALCLFVAVDDLKKKHLLKNAARKLGEKNA